MNNGISLTEDDIFCSDDETFTIGYHLAIMPSGKDGYEERTAKELKQQILNNQAIVERFNQILSNYGTEPPKNNKTLTKVDDGVILQIHNIITNILSYIKDGTSPDGYSGAKNTKHSEGLRGKND